MNIVVLVPAYIEDERQVEMVRVQSLLRDRMRAYVGSGDVRIHSCIMYDYVANPLLDRVLDLDFSLKFFGRAMYPERAQPNGIRRPVECALRALGGIFCGQDDVYLLRVIQDTVVDDASQMLNNLVDLARMPGSFLGGGLESCEDIEAYLTAVKLPWQLTYGYIQGAVMFARLDTWIQHYLRLPAEVTHYSDDSVMSQLVLHGGGELVGMPGCWRHCHDAPVDEFRAIYRDHAAQLRALSNQ
jgi:hypothetical protein